MPKKNPFKEPKPITYRGKDKSQRTRRSKDALDIIAEDIEEQFKSAAYNTALTLNMELEIAFERAIEAFYKHYIPMYYKRTYSTFYASDLFTDASSVSNFEPQESGKGYKSSIVIDSSNIKGDPYRADKDWVFDRTYFKGIHGNTLGEQREWGKNEYWTNYLKRMSYIFPERYPSSYRNQKYVNQYKKFRDNQNRKLVRETRNDYQKLLRKFGVEKKIEGYGISHWMTMYQYGERFMLSNTPDDLMKSSYSKLKTDKNISRLINHNLVFYLAQRRY